jgi:hypothetical protein
MKLILGDNQFFGVNHADFKKAEQTKALFISHESIINYIHESLNLGLDGFMINSNDLGFRVVQDFDFKNRKTECHYSIPYPHKYAGIVNDSGVLSLVSLVFKQLKIKDLFSVLKFIVTFNATHLLPIIVRMEIPKSLPKGSVVYLQNVVTDLTMGLKNGDKILGAYIKTLNTMGYVPGLITLNPVNLIGMLRKHHSDDEIFVCFNINYSGFNVFPSVSKVVDSITEVRKNTNWKLMGMSIFSSGSKGISINKSIDFIKSLELDYVVFGSSKLDNISKNLSIFKTIAE